MDAHDPPLTGTPAPGAASEAEVLLLHGARESRDRVRLATRVAAFNGGSMLVCAVLAVPLALVGVGSGWLCVVLAAFGAIELHGRRLMLSHSPGAARFLALNQVALLAGVWIYCGIQLHGALTAELPLPSGMGEYAELLTILQPGQVPDLAAGHAWLNEVYRRALLGFYGGLAVGALLMQGGGAYFYFTRETHLRTLRLLPTWARQRLEGDFTA